MPGFDGTGPTGRGPRSGWGRGWCRPVYLAQKADEKKPREAQAPTSEPVERNGVYQPPVEGIYGVGRGGIPWGCGRGFCGGRFRGRDRYW